MSEGSSLQNAATRLRHLRATLQELAKKDPDQEVRGIAVPVVDAVIDHAKDALGDDPIVGSIAGAMSAEAIGEGSIRASDALIVVDQLLAAVESKIPKPRMRTASVSSPDFPRRKQF